MSTPSFLRDQGRAIDRPYVRRRLIEFVGEGDERLTALTAIEATIDVGD